MSKHARFPSAVAALVLGLTLSACSEPPLDMVAAAGEAARAARAAGAEEYAPEALQAVVEAKAALTAEMAAQVEKVTILRRYGRAQQLAEAYLSAAEAALAATEAAFKQAETEVVALMNEGWTTLAEAPALLASVPRGRLSAQEMASLRADLASAEEGLKLADPLIPLGRYLEARVHASHAVEALNRVRDAVARAKEGAVGG